MKAGELAEALGLALRGDPDADIHSLAPLERASPGELAFVAGARQRGAMLASKASLYIVSEALAKDCPVDHLVSPTPYVSFAKASWILTPEDVAEPGIHPMAHVDDSAELGDNVSIGAFASVAAGARIGDGTRLGDGCRIAAGVHVGARCRLFTNVTIARRVSIGDDCRLQSGVVLGSEGFGYAPTPDGWHSIHQTGGVRLGHRVHVGANTTIDSGALDPTVIEDGVILDNLIQLGHNVHIGENTAVASCTGVAGSTHIGKRCLIGGACNILGHITIADDVTVTGTTFVSRSITEKGTYGSAMPMQTSVDWRRTFLAITRLSELLRRVRRLEKATENKGTQ